MYTAINNSTMHVKQGVAYSQQWTLSSTCASDIETVTLTIPALGFSKTFDMAGDDVQIGLTIVETSELAVGTYYYGLEIEYADGTAEEEKFRGMIEIAEPIEYDYSTLSDEETLAEIAQKILAEKAGESGEGD